VRIIKATLHGVLETCSRKWNRSNERGALQGFGQRQPAQSQRRKTEPHQTKSFHQGTTVAIPESRLRICTPLFPNLFLLARAGLRIGEAIALQIGDLDFVNRLVNVQRNLVKGEIGLPKSNLTRQVDMSTQLAHVLGHIVLDRKEQLLRLGLSLDELSSLWLFQNEAGKPIDDSKVRKVFGRVLIKAGLAQRNLHFLGHTFASLLIQQGESLAYVKEQMGHSSIDITVDIYGHLVPGGNRQAVDKLDDSDQFGMETKWKHFRENRPLEEKYAMELIEKAGATRRSRTGDLLITNQLLCRLS
jgi:integrase